MGSRVSHFAFISTGASLGGWLGPCYWRISQALYGVLRDEYAYPNEAIYRLSEAGEFHQPGIGLATLDNFIKVFDHLGKVTQPDDHVFIAIIGHGVHSKQENNQSGDYAHLLVNSRRPGDVAPLSPTMLAKLLGNLKARQMTIVLHPCFSGGFIPALTGDPDRVILTSTDADHGNDVGWIEMVTAALSRRGRQKGRSMKEVSDESTRGSNIECAGRDPESPQLHNPQAAANRFLGNDGKSLSFSDQALENLRKENAELRLAYRW
jgi:hypothetical protein